MKPHLIFKGFVLSLATFALVACQGESNQLAPAPVDYGQTKRSTDGVKIDINAQVDILFVIDDSGSMKAHQATLAKNIDRFVDGFGKNSIIDFHIGVMSIWDSQRYGDYDVESNKVVREGIVPALGLDGKPQFDPIGHLRPLKVPVGQENLLKGQAGNFVAKGENFVEILRETLKIGVRDYQKQTSYKSKKVDGNDVQEVVKLASGPEYEEVFTPVIAGLRPPISTTWNKGFFRENAHLVVVFVTDANDASQLTASSLFRFLTDLKGHENFTVFGVINPTDQRLTCARDPSGPPRKIEDLIRLTNGRILNMCANYANDLVEIGKMIQDRTLKEIRFKPETLPVVDSIKVTYGTEVIQPGLWSGWSYDAGDKEIIIRGASKWPHQAGASIQITFEPVDPSRASSHCIGCGVVGK